MIRALCLVSFSMAPAPSYADLTRSLAEVEAARTPVVTTSYGAMRVTGAIARTHPAPPDKTLDRLQGCLRSGAVGNAKVDLAAYDWPGARAARDHEVCLLPIFVALGDRATVQEWVQAVIAPKADPDCPAVWNIKQPARWGPSVVHVWRSRLPVPLAIDVFDRTASWSEDMPAPVHSLLRVTFDDDGLPLAVKYNAFTFGNRYGLARC